MSNDNKTLADAQPGGRVRLGDQLPPLPYPNYPVSKTGLQNNAYTASQMWDYARAALSAQPSPGGQDALAEAARRVISDIDSGDYHGEISEATYAALEDTLAARQPVGEPVFQVVEGPGEHRPRGTRQLREFPPIGTKLYAAPPAQAVDLGQFRPMVEEFRHNWANYGRTMTAAGKDTSTARQNVDAADRLLALIDSQAVGNG